MNHPVVKTKLSNIKNIIIVASGKGGVGKSTIAAGMAMSLSMNGNSTGLLDADMSGPSVPVLFDLKEQRPATEVHDGKSYLTPFVKFGIKLMSIGFLIETKQAIIWRGPRISSGISQLLTETHWGELDYLIIDTPPGTGDVHITLLQNFEITGVVLVTTPQHLSVSDVKRAVDMYRDKHIGTSILGVIENMAWFSPTQHPEEKYYIFGNGGGAELAKEFGIPLLAQIPINEKVCESCDGGRMNDLFADEAVYKAFDKMTKKMVADQKRNPRKLRMTV